MEVGEYSIRYHEDVLKKDLPSISTSQKKAIKSAIEKKLFTSPETFGKPLRRSLKGRRKLRVGDYRVIFQIKDATVYVLIIGHRSIVYKTAIKRL